MAGDSLESARDSLFGVRTSGCAPAPQRPLTFPTLKGLNYGTPPTATGQYVGLEWLRSGTGVEDKWPDTRNALVKDLDFIEQHDLGRVLRVFIGLDQLMVWDKLRGFAGFNESGLSNFETTLEVFQAHSMKIIGVLYDQEEVGNLGNFHFDALDGSHAAMRAGYLRATRLFLQRFGSSPEVIGWDLFNEAYNSLGRDGGLPMPPTADPVSPNYPGPIVHDWIRDLYQVAKCAAPGAWFTASDTTELYWKAIPDVGKYDDSVDFYDIHVYDDHPKLRNWRAILKKPTILGEAAASTEGNHYQDQTTNPRVISYLLEHASQAGLSAVLAHSADNNIYRADRGTLTPSGLVVSCFGRKGANRASCPGSPSALRPNPGAAGVRAGGGA